MSDELPAWRSLALEHPKDGEYVEVLAESWSRPRWLKFAENFTPQNPRFVDVTTGMHFWYPKRMMWRARA